MPVKISVKISNVKKKNSYKLIIVHKNVFTRLPMP